MATVAVLGGGVGGLTTAHELSQRGFDVTVYEKLDLFGGKARSMEWPSALGGVPGEHGFRFFPGFYRHITNTMKRVPFPAPGDPDNAFSNLVEANQGAFAQVGKEIFAFPVHEPHTTLQVLADLHSFFSQDVLGLQPGDLEFFLEVMVKVMTMSDARRMAEMEHESWWDFSGAAVRGPQYQNLLARGMTRSLVAMKAEIANSRTVGTILTRMIRDMTKPGDTMDRLLVGPTSEVFVDAWKAEIATNGVTFKSGVTVNQFTVSAGKVQDVQADEAGTAITIDADYYVAAVPFEVMEGLVAASPGMAVAAPSVANLGLLHSDWMNGIQFYLNRELGIVFGHVIYADSPWALTSISQRQFWKEFNLPEVGGQTIHDILSVDVSNWEAIGPIHGKPANECTPYEIAEECWGQLKDHLAHGEGFAPLEDGDLVTWYLDPSISFPGAPDPGGISPDRDPLIGPTPPTDPWGNPTNDEPLLINTVDSWVLRPTATTEISNLFLASDYVQTNTGLASMEGANEAGRHAANGVVGVHYWIRSRF